MSIYLPRTHIHVIYSCCRAYCRYTPSYKALDDGDNKIEEKKNSSVYNIAFHLGPATAGTRRAVFTSTYAIYNNTLDAQCCRLQWYYI